MESITHLFSVATLSVSGLVASCFLFMWLQSLVSWRGLLAAALALLFGVGTQVLEAHIRAPNVFVGDMPWHNGILFAVFACVVCVIGMWLALKERKADTLAAVTVSVFVVGVLLGTRVLAYWEFGSHERRESRSPTNALMEVLRG